MAERTDAYAAAIVAIARGENALQAVEDELLTVARAVRDNHELRERLTDIHLPAEQKLKLVESSALDNAHPATRSALAAIIVAGRAGDLGEIAQRVAELAAHEREAELAEVYVAVPLDPSRQDALRQALERSTGRKLEVKFHVDPSVVGGVRARIGDTVIDGSVARRLDEIKARLNT